MNGTSIQGLKEPEMRAKLRDLKKVKLQALKKQYVQFLLAGCFVSLVHIGTCLINNEDIIKGMELGADDYVRKPFDMEVLTSKARQLIKNRAELKKAYTKLLIPSQESQEQQVAVRSLAR